MTPREQAAFTAGIEIARQMAPIADAPLELRDNANDGPPCRFPLRWETRSIAACMVTLKFLL